MPMTAIQQFDLLLEGKITSPFSGKYFDGVNPSTGDVFVRIADANEMDMQVAIQSARLAFDHGRWSKMPVSERGSYLIKIGQAIREHAKDLADLECASTGKTIKHTTFIDVPTCAETFEYFGALKNGLEKEDVKQSSPLLSVVEREPVGVIALIIPWNYPLIMTAWKMAPALLAGNTIILKPSSTGCAAVMALAKIIADAGLPKGVVNVISSTSNEAKDLLIKHPGIDMISFTGGTSTGEKVMAQASKGVKKVSLELGGKSPNIVFADCDMDAAIGGTLSAIFMNQGQMCTAGSRLLVEDKIYKEFTQKLIERAKSLKIGPADSFETEFGPLVSVAHRDQVLKWIEQGLKEGGKIACGGKVPQGHSKGAYLEPTIFIDARNNMTIAQEEIFGPVLCVIPFISIEDAVVIANDSKYGLAAMVWTKDLNKANDVARRLRCGTVWINTYGAFPNEAPFGGYKQSGFGRELGKDGLLEYTQAKHIAIDQTPGGKSLVTSWF